MAPVPFALEVQELITAVKVRHRGRVGERWANRKRTGRIRHGPRGVTVAEGMTLFAAGERAELGAEGRVCEEVRSVGAVEVAEVEGAIEKGTAMAAVVAERPDLD